MHSRRKIYYTVVITSLIWICGTVTFMFLDDIEVTVAFKRKVAESKAFAYSTSNRIFSEGDNKRTDENSDGYGHEGQPEITENPERKESRKANYEHIVVKRDPLLPGELGRGVNADPAEKEKEKRGFDLHAFNMLVSDKISVHRSLKDYRSERYVFIQVSFFIFHFLVIPL